MTLRIAAVSTHPIQYFAPLYRELTERHGVDLAVYYLTDFAQRPSVDAGFGVAYAWDVDLLSGYGSRYLVNRAAKPSPRFWGSDCPELGQVLTPASVDAVLLPGYKCRGYLQALVHAKRNGVAVVMRGESAQHERRNRVKQVIREAALRLVFTQIDAFVAIGDHTRRHYLRMGVPAERIFLGPYSVDNQRWSEEYRANAPQKHALRAEWDIPRDAIVGVLSGKLTAKKSPLLALRAASALADPRLWLLFAGDGPQRADLEREAATLGFTNFRITGFLNQSRVGRAYATADFLMMPSAFGETWGLAVNEGMLFGLPAIVSDQVGCAPDLVTDGVTGFRFSSGDVEAFRSALASMVAPRERIAIMGAAARERVLECCSIERAVDGIVAAVRYALQQRGAR